MEEGSALQLRTLDVEDVAAVLRIQAQCYGVELVESGAVFVRRLQTGSHCSLAAVQGGELLAYLAAYWSLPGRVTPFNGDFGEHADSERLGESSVLYLHDMAVSPAAKGRRLGSRMVDSLRASARARGIRRSALVSVQDSRSFWEQQGYAVAPVGDAVEQAHLSSYGADAVYMVATL